MDSEVIFEISHWLSEDENIRPLSRYWWWWIIYTNAFNFEGCSSGNLGGPLCLKYSSDNEKTIFSCLLDLLDNNLQLNRDQNLNCFSEFKQEKWWVDGLSLHSDWLSEKSKQESQKFLHCYYFPNDIQYLIEQYFKMIQSQYF